MKKLSLAVITLLIVATCACCLFGCTVKEEVTSIEKIDATLTSGTVIYVGDTFDSSVVKLTATLSDGTKTVITSTAATSYDKSGLKLDARNRYTEVGTFTLKITFLKYDDITVSITVNEAVDTVEA